MNRKIRGLATIGVIAATLAASPSLAGSPQTPASWTGFYIGANVGYGWGREDMPPSPNDPAAAARFLPLNGGPPPSLGLNNSGALGGIQFGYNFQFNQRWLTGLETDFDWSGLKGSARGVATLSSSPSAATLDEQVKSFGTVRARLGYLPTANLLTYITGGFAYGNVESSGSYGQTNSNGIGSGVTFMGYSAICAGGSTCFSGTSSSMTTGWTAGAGFEYAILENISLRAEYLYVSLGGKPLNEFALTPAAGNLPASFSYTSDRTNFNVVRLGLNYRC